MTSYHAMSEAVVRDTDLIILGRFLQYTSFFGKFLWERRKRIIFLHPGGRDRDNRDDTVFLKNSQRLFPLPHCQFIVHSPATKRREAIEKTKVGKRKKKKRNSTKTKNLLAVLVEMFGTSADVINAKLQHTIS